MMVLCSSLPRTIGHDLCNTDWDHADAIGRRRGRQQRAPWTPGRNCGGFSCGGSRVLELGAAAGGVKPGAAGEPGRRRGAD
jgi:hypothetical protein